MAAQELCDTLKSYGVSAERKSIYADIQALVSVSQQFFGWMTGIGPKMQLVGPEHTKNEYVEYMKKILEIY